MRICLLLCCLALAGSVSAREASKPSATQSAALYPAYCTATHDVGRLGLLVSNGGFWGIPPYGIPYATDSSGCHLGSLALEPPTRGDEYPLGSGNSYMCYAALWVGGITEKGDTLVSVGYAPMYEHGSGEANLELHPDVAPFGEIIKRSLAYNDPFGAGRSDQDYVASYTDTFTRGVPGLASDFLSRLWHQPLGIQVKQTSCAWSGSLVNDFILVEYQITNIGRQDLHACYVGLRVDPAVDHLKRYRSLDSTVSTSASDEVVGFLPTYPAAHGCGFDDTLNVAWAADNDGDPFYQTHQWVSSGPFTSVLGVAGLRVLQMPLGSQQNFNWWVDYPWWEVVEPDWGPRHKVPFGSEPRNFRTGGSGEPQGDVNKYYLMSNDEIDYDQPRAAEITTADPLWEYPPEYMYDWGYAGYIMGYLVGIGPFDLERGETQTVVVAYILGENFHSDPRNGERLYPGRDVDGWYAHVDFSDLAKNAKQAEWVYDNPGVDTDGDGYTGKTRVCVLDSQLVDGHWLASVAETTYYSGDGVPDWRAVGPPPPPKVWLTPVFQGVKIRFNGQQSETTKDLVSNRIDFEGYNLYLGRDEREASLSLVAGFDHANYDKFVWKKGNWTIEDIPFTKEQLRCLYGEGDTKCQDSTFEPTAFTLSQPYRLAGYADDSVFAFYPHAYNAPLSASAIHKIYPEAAEPVPGEPLEADQYTADGYVKYYEYECTISGLLPTVPYYLNVTAFDYGDPANGVETLESSKVLGLQPAYCLADANQLSETLPPVYTYPNPYYGDGRYARTGYEDRYSNGANPDRNRLIHFVNVPASCVIRIYSLDGDLVRAIEHEKEPSDPTAHHETWDVINRNIQTVVSGLYYWTVEDRQGKVQIGKLVIIR